MTTAFSRMMPWCAAATLSLATGAQAATQIFTDPSLFDHPMVIDFEPLGSGSTLVNINQHLANLGINATVSFSGGGAQIADVTSSARAASLNVSPGADGGPVSGSWAFEGGVGDPSVLTIAFADGSRPNAIGAFWGGVILLPEARAIVTLDDDSIVSESLVGHLPGVPDNAGNNEAINGFFGINGNGHTIKSVTFTGRNDLYSMDDVTFGSLASPVPEPATVVLISIGLLGLLKATTRRA